MTGQRRELLLTSLFLPEQSLSAQSWPWTRKHTLIGSPEIPGPRLRRAAATKQGLLEFLAQGLLPRPGSRGGRCYSPLQVCPETDLRGAQGVLRGAPSLAQMSPQDWPAPSPSGCPAPLLTVNLNSLESDCPAWPSPWPPAPDCTGDPHHLCCTSSSF